MGESFTPPDCGYIEIRCEGPIVFVYADGAIGVEAQNGNDIIYPKEFPKIVEAWSSYAARGFEW